MKLNKKTTILFLVGTFLLSYLSWGLVILANQFGLLKYGTPFGMIVFLLGGLSPTIISCITLIRRHEVSGLKQICKDTFHFRQKPIAYLAILFFITVSFLIPGICGNVKLISPFYYVIFSIPVMIVGGGLEEVGWRYILQPALEKKLPFFVATAIVGVIWAVWHLPLFYITGTSQNLNMTFPVFAVNVFGIAFMLAFVRKLAAGIWPCVLCHAIYNAMGVSFGVKEDLKTTIVGTVVVVILATILSKLVENSRNKD